MLVLVKIDIRLHFSHRGILCYLPNQILLLKMKVRIKYPDEKSDEACPEKNHIAENYLFILLRGAFEQ